VLNTFESSVGLTVEVRGEHWPVGEAVLIALAWADQAPGLIEAGQLRQIGQADVDGSGNFVAGIVVPAGQGWENGGQAIIVVYTTDYQHFVSAGLMLLPPTSTPEPPLPPPEESPPEEVPPGPTEEGQVG